MAPNGMLDPVTDLDVGYLVPVYETRRISRWHFISMACSVLCSSAVRVDVSHAYRNTDKAPESFQFSMLFKNEMERTRTYPEEKRVGFLIFLLLVCTRSSIEL